MRLLSVERAELLKKRRYTVKTVDGIVCDRGSHTVTYVANVVLVDVPLKMVDYVDAVIAAAAARSTMIVTSG